MMGHPLSWEGHTCPDTPHTPTQHSVQPPGSTGSALPHNVVSSSDGTPSLLDQLQWTSSSAQASLISGKLPCLLPSEFELNTPESVLLGHLAHNSTAASALWVHPASHVLLFFPIFSLNTLQGTKDTHNPSLLRPQASVPGANGLCKTQESIWDLKCICWL